MLSELYWIKIRSWILLRSFTQKFSRRVPFVGRQKSRTKFIRILRMFHFSPTIGMKVKLLNSKVSIFFFCCYHSFKEKTKYVVQRWGKICKLVFQESIDGRLHVSRKDIRLWCRNFYLSNNKNISWLHL